MHTQVSLFVEMFHPVNNRKLIAFENSVTGIIELRLKFLAFVLVGCYPTSSWE